MNGANRSAMRRRRVWCCAAALCMLGALVLPATSLATSVAGAPPLSHPGGLSDVALGYSTGPISIHATPSTGRLGRPFVLSGALPIGENGLPIRVMVKKPGKARYSYSTTRSTYGASGSVSKWWYRYTPKLRGTYYFFATFPGNAAHSVANSPVMWIRVK